MIYRRLGVYNQRQCLGCEEYFDLTHKKRKFCNKKCYDKAIKKCGRYDQDFMCERCGVQFKRRKYDKPVFCSRLCANRTNAELRAMK